MKLLIVTQTVDVDDPALGFFAEWINSFARNCERVEVICLRKGRYESPANVRIHSLGKEDGPVSRVTYARRFLSLAWRLRGQYDSVFVHMNPEYLVLAGWLWSVLRKRVGLWYMHKSVTPSLRVGVWFVHVIFTASRESFRIETPKLRIVGHGISMTPLPKVPADRDVMRIVSLGRISESKGIREALAALDLLHAQGKRFQYTIAGSAVTQTDRLYEQALRASIANKSYASDVHFVGAVHHRDIPLVLAQSDVFLHLSDTGSLDKAALEALLAGVPVVTSNDSVKTLVPHEWQVERLDAQAVAQALLSAHGAELSDLTATVQREHTLSLLIPKITANLEMRKQRGGHTLLMRLLLIARDVTRLFASKPEVSILCYHSISDAAEVTAITSHTFEAQLAMLRSSGATFVSLEQVVAWQRGETLISGRAVAITFDDGYADFKTAALPLLEKYQAPATVFVVGDRDAARAQLGNTTPLLSDDDITALQSIESVTVGYHSRTHANPMDPHIDVVSECAPEYGAFYFAYPGGKYTNEYIDELKRRGYTAACSIKPELVAQGANPLLLPRSVVERDVPLWMVRHYTSASATWYRRLRRLFVR